MYYYSGINLIGQLFMTVTSWWFYTLMKAIQLTGHYLANVIMNGYPVSGSLNSVVIVCTQMAVHVGV